MSRLHIFGEDHNSLAEIARIELRIKEIRPEYLLHELLHQDICLSRDEIKSRLADCEEGNLCDPRLNKDIYQLGHYLNMKLVGIDLDMEGKERMTLRNQFEKRENHMVSLIEKYRLKGTVVVVVGDAHLRTEPSQQLGRPSFLQTVFAGRAVIERSRTAPYSPEASIPSFLKW